MALEKSITLPSTAVGNYLRIVAVRMDGNVRECSAQIDLYASEAAAKTPGADPHRSAIYMLRLEGAKFDQWVGKAALATAAQAGRDLYGQLYSAAKVEPLKCALGNHGPIGEVADA